MPLYLPTASSPIFENELETGTNGMTQIHAISPPGPKLIDLVLSSFQQACGEGRLNAAEHLLAAIEELSGGEFDFRDPGASPQLAAAYGVLLDRSHA